MTEYNNPKESDLIEFKSISKKDTKKYIKSIKAKIKKYRKHTKFNIIVSIEEAQKCTVCHTYVNRNNECPVGCVTKD